MTLLKDLIDIPQQVHWGDFVVDLTENFVPPDLVLGDYLVKDGLVEGSELTPGASATRSNFEVVSVAEPYSVYTGC